MIIPIEWAVETTEMVGYRFIHRVGKVEICGGKKMINRGPVDVVVLALGAPHFDGSILNELKRQTATGTIRVLDAMVLFKAESGECWRVDLEDMPASDLQTLDFVATESGAFSTPMMPRRCGRGWCPIRPSSLWPSSTPGP